MAPLVWIALGLGGIYLMSRKSESKPITSGGGSVLPTITPGTTSTTSPATTIQVPSQVIQETGGEVAPEHTPSVTITVPHATGDIPIPDNVIAPSSTPQQIATSVLPSVAQAISTLPTGATPQQVATAVIPAITQAVTGAGAQAAQAAAAATQAAQNATPLHSEEIKIDQDPDGTIALAKSMINAEESAGWKTALQPEISLWQGKKKLTVDGKFGPKSALAMASEVGVLPLIRYFPSNSPTKDSAVKAYRDQLNAMASGLSSSNPMHAAALRSSAVYEQGQGWVTKPAAIPSSARLAQATTLATALKGV